MLDRPPPRRGGKQREPQSFRKVKPNQTRLRCARDCAFSISAIATAHRFRYGLLVFDIATILFIIATSFMARAPWLEWLDLIFGLLILADFCASGRLIASGSGSTKPSRVPITVNGTGRARATTAFCSRGRRAIKCRPVTTIRKPGIGLFSGIFAILSLIPAIIVHIKRFHDRDKSGWWVLIGFIPIIGAIGS